MGIDPNLKRNRGGFIDIEAIAQGVSSAATALYQTTKDFASWSAGLVQQFGNKIQPYLKSLWNKINYAVDFFTPTSFAQTERGNIINPFQSSDSPFQSTETAAKVVGRGRMFQIPAGPGLRFTISNRTVFNDDGTVQRIGTIDVGRDGIVSETPFRKKSGVSSDEIELYKTISPESFTEGKINVNTLTKALKERGPILEVRTLGVGEGTERSPRGQALAELQHLLDTRHVTYDWNQATLRDENGNTIDENDDRYTEVWREIRRVENLTGPEATETPVTQARYSSIAPKPESQMPGYVEGLVRIPQSTVKAQNLRDREAGLDAQRGFNLYTGPHFGAEDTNVVAFFRGYEETMPDGSKAFHIIEVQSDWANAEKKRAEGYGEAAQFGAAGARGASQQGHPLLRAYNTLALKSAINHAKSIGATSIIISDAETAMMTEGHDKASLKRQLGQFNTRSEADQVASDARKSGKYSSVSVDENVGLAGPNNPISTWTVNTSEVKQEAGMRLHYDEILPNIAEDLTGDKGKKVNLGTHEKAYKPDTGFVRENAGLLDPETVRENIPGSPVFKEPVGAPPSLKVKGGQPKTSITGRQYSLAKTSGVWIQPHDGY